MLTWCAHSYIRPPKPILEPKIFFQIFRECISLPYIYFSPPHGQSMFFAFPDFKFLTKNVYFAFLDTLTPRGIKLFPIYWCRIRYSMFTHSLFRVGSVKLQSERRSNHEPDFCQVWHSTKKSSAEQLKNLCRRRLFKSSGKLVGLDTL